MIGRMPVRQPLFAALLAAAIVPVAAPLAAAPPASAGNAIARAVADPHREAADRARDRYRHPVQTLEFFGVAPGQTVVEFLPGGGWYTGILGPLLKDRGHYIALVSSSGKAVDGAKKLIADHSQVMGANAGVATVDFATGASTLAPGSADRVLTFRNIHNLIMGGDGVAANVFAAFYKALKPGGVLGVVDHRLPEDRDSALEKKSGYLKRSTIVKLATDAGFRLAGESQVNANPKDRADYPGGVWTLPPTLAGGEADKARYLAIGESDRMTLKFVKPE